MSGKGFIAPEPARACELCGKRAETRPCGPKGERICFECGQKDEAATRRGFERYVLGDGPPESQPSADERASN